MVSTVVAFGKGKGLCNSRGRSRKGQLRFNVLKHLQVNVTLGTALPRKLSSPYAYTLVKIISLQCRMRDWPQFQCSVIEKLHTMLAMFCIHES